MTPEPRHRLIRGFTLLEIMVSVAVLAGIVLTLSYAFVPLKTATSQSDIALDLDAHARRVLSDMRQELRGSGFDSSGTLMLSTPASLTSTTTVSFQTRQSATTWSPVITYALVADTPSTFKGVPGTINRYKIQRTESGLTTDVAKDVEDMSFSLLAAGGSGQSATVRVALTLTSNDPNWNGSSGPPPAIRRTYYENIQLLNPMP